MRLLTALTVIGLLLAGCGGDEPEPTPQQNPQPQQQQQSQPQQQPEPEQQPEPQQPEPEPEPEPEPMMSGDLYTVQVGAFTNEATANEWRRRLASQDMPVWTVTAEINGQTYHRLRVGALPSVTDTRRLAEMISQRYEWPVWVAPLSTRDRLPMNAVENTRMILQGG